MIDKLKEIDRLTNGEISDALNKGQFQILMAGDCAIGFFTWFNKIKDGKRHTFINNMWIEPEFRKQRNLLFLRQQFRDVVRGPYIWRNRKHKRLFFSN